MRPYREKVFACARGGTFKYFLPRDDVVLTWRKLEVEYGSIVRNETMKTMEIEGPRLILRATLLANPITVFRKRLCVAADIERFHSLVGYSESDDARLG